MNHRKVHDQIIERARHRRKPDCYCEKHHVVPRSMGGADDKSNIVVLTAREHFLIHWLLWKIHRNQSMTFAFHAMTKPVGNGRLRYTSRSFAYARQAMAQWITDNWSGEKSPCYGKPSPQLGSKRSENARKVMSLAAKERVKKHGPTRQSACINLDTGEVFPSISSAKRHYGISNIANSIDNGGRAGGFSFAKLDDAGNPIAREFKLKGYASGERSPSAKPVLNVDTGEIFPTAAAAAKSIGLTKEAVSTAIREGRKCKRGKFIYV